MKSFSAWHLLAPLGFAVLPVISLYSSNPEVPLYRLAPSLVAVSLLAALVTAVLYGALRTSAKASAAASLFLILFFSYGIVLGGTSSVWSIVAYNALVVLYVLFLVYARRTGRRLDALATVLTLFAVSTVAVPVVVVAWRTLAWRGDAAADEAAALPGRTVAVERLPDIYHIVLDGYSRGDVLEGLYGVDNGPFLDALRSRGFYVAERSHSNYTQTHLSLASTLSLDYLAESEEVDADRYRYRLSETMIKRNRVVGLLRQHGYTFVNVGSGYQGTHPNRHADLQIDPPGLDLGEFELNVLLMTPLAELPPVYNLVVAGVHRKRVLFAFDALKRLGEAPSPRFVFAHILCPHPPFVFDADGGPSPVKVKPSIDDASHFKGPASEYVAGYSRQVLFVNRQVLDVVDAILAGADPANRPIILIQGDHGGGLTYHHSDIRRSRFWERTSILNAYLLPEGARGELYESITPVNTYRVVFNELFAAGLPLLPDRSYYAPWRAPWHRFELPPRVVERPAREGDE